MSWLSDPANQKTLAFVGSGFVAVAAGVWAVFKFVRQRPAVPTNTTVIANRDSTAAGRDVNVSPPPKP